VLKLHAVESGYDLVQVLWNVELEVAEGEFVALLGPNGAGKTTTLRTIAGYVPARKGTIEFRGKSIVGKAPHEISRLGIGYSSEGSNLFAGMSIHENLLVGAYTVKDKKQIAAQEELVFELFPRLHERRNQLAGTLSGGERKMLAIARGLMPSPSLMLVDEPSLGLAPIPTLAAFEALKQLSHRGTTILLVEQNVNTTLHLVDRAYVLEQGKVVLEGTGAALLSNKDVQEAYLGI
jgi:branched-chain amino acid transport system ATP-binding protein